MKSKKLNNITFVKDALKHFFATPTKSKEGCDLKRKRKISG